MHKQNKKYDLISEFECSYIGIQGEEGAGKTSLLTALLIVHHQHRNKDKSKLLKRKLKHFNRENQTDVDVPDTFIYTDFDNKVTPKTWRNYVEFNQIRMPNEDKESFIYFPYGAVIATSESFDIENNKIEKSSKLDMERYKFIKKRRHNHITLISETQDLDAGAKWERTKFRTIISAKECRVYHWFGCSWLPVRKVKWKVWIYHGSKQLVKLAFNDIPPLTKFERKNSIYNGEYRTMIEEREITFKGNIFKYYDSEECEEEFTEGLLAYKTTKTNPKTERGE